MPALRSRWTTAVELDAAPTRQGFSRRNPCCHENGRSFRRRVGSSSNSGRLIEIQAETVATVADEIAVREGNLSAPTRQSVTRSSWMRCRLTGHGRDPPSFPPVVRRRTKPKRGRRSARVHACMTRSHDPFRSDLDRSLTTRNDVNMEAAEGEILLRLLSFATKAGKRDE